MVQAPCDGGVVSQVPMIEKIHSPNPHWANVRHPQIVKKLTVWCALWAGGIIGPYFFKNDEGHNITVNGDRYRAMITNFFIPELNNHDVQELWFQQNGATCHTARTTIDLLKDAFATRGLLVTDHVILNHGQVTWTTPELAPPLLTTTPHQRGDVSALDIFNVHRCPTRRVFSGTGIELLTRQATARYLYHSATAATPHIPDQSSSPIVMKHIAERKTLLSSVPHHRLSNIGRRAYFSPYAQRYIKHASVFTKDMPPASQPSAQHQPLSEPDRGLRASEAAWIPDSSKTPSN
ncbi:uncharacterized protein TNCV_4183541 [Trichonephila clavipes]|nr:uncharacterized protein TNCV_4183541 [Trichonephila clavipes]